MKNYQKLAVFMALGIATLNFSSANAATSETLNFTYYELHSGAKFNCDFSGPGQVSIETQNSLIKGFCSGYPNVTRPGHIAADSQTLQPHYFDVELDPKHVPHHYIGTEGSVVITAVNGTDTISCHKDSGGKTPYAPSSTPACALPPR
ncbi:MAG: hypothetical protein K0S08_179 [Gammaproteobacteria bacterium]|jgi:hypothetical protein|nr:hypothetical protein [Gammaproteobacteria bacterium]